jgi:hypothetical protein
MSYVVDYKNVSTIGLELSPVAASLAGLRANEARYFKNKYDHKFTTVPAAKSKKLVDWVADILKKERDIAIASEAARGGSLQCRKHQVGAGVLRQWARDKRTLHNRWSQEARGRLQTFGRHGGTRRARDEVQIRAAEVEARRDNSRIVLCDQGRILTFWRGPLLLRRMLRLCSSSFWRKKSGSGHSRRDVRQSGRLSPETRHLSDRRHAVPFRQICASWALTAVTCELCHPWGHPAGGSLGVTRRWSAHFLPRMICAALIAGADASKWAGIGGAGNLAGVGVQIA